MKMFQISVYYTISLLYLLFITLYLNYIIFTTLSLHYLYLLHYLFTIVIFIALHFHDISVYCTVCAVLLLTTLSLHHCLLLKSYAASAEQKMVQFGCLALVRLLFAIWQKCGWAKQPLPCLFAGQRSQNRRDQHEKCLTRAAFSYFRIAMGGSSSSIIIKNLMQQQGHLHALCLFKLLTKQTIFLPERQPNKVSLKV